MKRTKQFVILLLTLLFFAGGGEMKAESATATFTGTEGTNVGKTLTFDYEFTASGSSITLTISNVNGTGIAELDTTPYIYEWTTGSQEGRGKAMTYTWNDFVPTTPLRVKLHWQAENGDFISDYLIYPENLTSRKTVYPLGGLKSFHPVDVVTEDNLQKITQDGNTDNIYLFPENGANLDYNKTLGIQGFYIDLGAAKSIGGIQSTWEGADCGANIYLTNTEPAADGSLTGETLIATFDNAQESAKNVTVTVENSGRYIVFVPTKATNYDWGVKIRTFAAFERQSSVLTSFVVNPSYVEEGVATELTLSPKDQYGMVLSNGVSYTVSSGTLEGNSFTANSTGNVTITATYGGVSKAAIIYVVQKPVVSAEAVNVSSKTATINYWLPTASNTEINEDEIIFTVKQGTEVVSEDIYQKNEVVGEINKKTFVLESLQPSTTYTYTVAATHSASGLSSETSVQFTTEKERLTIWYKAGESDTEHGPYEGWTGELEKLITATDKGHQVLTEVTDLRIKGSLNNEDVKLLRRMAGGSTYVGETNVKKRVLIKAENAPNVYAWVDGSDPVQEFLGELPGTLITKKTDGYYEVEFTNTETVKIKINSQATEFTLAEGNNYFTYDGTTYTQVVENNSYGNLATLDLKEASFYHDGGVYMVAIENNNNNPISLELEYGVVVTKADIGNSMFRECSKLKNVILPDDCKIVGERAFYGGKVDDDISLESVTLPTGLERIEGYAFEKNEKLGEVTLPSTLKLIGYNAFCDCHAMTLGNDNGQLPNSITDIDNQAFANTSIAEVILPANASYTTVKTNVFGWSRELAKVTIPANVTTLMNGSFRDSKKLATIEDAAATITEIGDEAFMNDIALPSAEVNGLIAHLTTLNNSVFNGCTAVTEVNIPASVTTLKNLTFANCTNINRVTVNSATAPSGYTLTEGEMKNTNGETTDPFAAVNANYMTLTFAGAADGGYKSYREGTAKSNAFHRLLTKTLDEEKKSYDVAGQMHADVVLKRTMVEGWNTVALPFGVKADAGRDRDFTAAGVYQKAFNGDVAENNNFMIAVYRGIDNDVFKFLKYADYTTDPLDEFEPLLIRMGSGNISDNDEYTFVDVDLNYDFEENKLYRDGNAAGEVPVKRWDAASSSFKPFIGNYNREGADAIAPFVNCKDDYAFMGTYTTKTTSDWKKEDETITYEGGTPYAYKNLPSGYFLTAEDDYIIQGNKFYKVVGTKSYGLRGYRAWFQKQPTTSGARPAQLMFRVLELDSDTPTEIDSFDAVDSDVKPFDVYSIGGQLLRKQTKSLNGLPNGIYIVNGRKVAVGK